MKLSEFKFELPLKLVAQHPAEDRDFSKANGFAQRYR